jgi:hypothetical protein
VPEVDLVGKPSTASPSSWNGVRPPALGEFDCPPVISCASLTKYSCRPERAPGLRVAVHVETAAVLERRAGSSDNPTLAALLCERAAAHRRTALRLGTALAEQMTPARLPQTAGRGRT